MIEAVFYAIYFSYYPGELFVSIKFSSFLTFNYREGWFIRFLNFFFEFFDEDRIVVGITNVFRYPPDVTGPPDAKISS